MTTATKKSKITKIDYKIDSKLMDELYKVRLKLKKSIKYGDNIAGLCLLGEKNSIVDSFVPIISRSGCGDSPSVSHLKFERAFLKMIKKDRTVIGMALIRPGNYDSDLPIDFMSNIKTWKKTFKNILNTVWIVVSDKEIIPYSVKEDFSGYLTFGKCRQKIFIAPMESKMLRIAEVRRKIRKLPAGETCTMRNHLGKLALTIENGTSGSQIIKSIIKEGKVIEVKRNERLKNLEKQRKAQQKRLLETKKKIKEQNEKINRKKRQETAGMKDTTDLGGGYFLIKNKQGKEVLWKK